MLTWGIVGKREIKRDLIRGIPEVYQLALQLGALVLCRRRVRRRGTEGKERPKRELLNARRGNL